MEDITFYSSCRDFVGKDMYDCEDIPIIDHGNLMVIYARGLLKGTMTLQVMVPFLDDS